MSTATIDLYSPDVYVDGPPHAIFEELRRTSPVYWQDIPGEPGYWAMLKHADVVHVAREPKLFSASEGGIMLEDADPEQSGANAQHAAGDGPAPARRLPPAVAPQLQGPDHRRPREIASA